MSLKPHEGEQMTEFSLKFYCNSLKVKKGIFQEEASEHEAITS